MLKKNIKLKVACIEKRIKQYELARLLGIDESLISKHINGVRELSEENINKAAEFLKVNKKSIL